MCCGSVKVFLFVHNGKWVGRRQTTFPRWVLDTIRQGNRVVSNWKNATKTNSLLWEKYRCNCCSPRAECGHTPDNLLFSVEQPSLLLMSCANDIDDPKLPALSFLCRSCSICHRTYRDIDRSWRTTLAYAKASRSMSDKILVGRALGCADRRDEIFLPDDSGCSA